jgi:dTDP-4-amino-4,6-dideoxygalactose transaminase
VHQWGHPADIDGLLRVCAKYDLPLIEDCSHAHGTTYKGRAVGTFGTAAAFSLQTNKAVFAGEGGILVTSDPLVKDRAILLGHYRDRAKSDVEDETLRRYWVSGFGLKLRMSPFNAVVGLASLRAFPALRDERARCLTYFNTRLAEIPYLEPVSVAPDDSMGAWYGFKPLYLPGVLGVERSTLIRALQAEGVEVDAPSAPPLSTLPLYTDPAALYDGRAPHAPITPVEHPVAAYVGAHALSLPTFYRWDHDRSVIDDYVAAFAKVFEQRAALVEWERAESGAVAHAASAALPRDAVGAGR